jgi:3-oxoadipate enol-lactonase
MESQRIRLTDHETLVATSGESGPAVLLVHSLGVDWRMWREVIERLSATGRVFAYDLRGHGQATGAPTPFTMADMGRDLVEVMDALGLDQAHIAGLSLGGAVVQSAAVRAPERFASMALLATTDTPFPEIFEERAHFAESSGMEALVIPTLTRWFTPEALAADGAAVAYAREHIRSFAVADWAATWRAYKTLDVRSRLRDFGGPTLVLAGEADASISVEAMGELAKRLSRGAAFEVLPGTPHMQTLESPGLVAEALDRFWWCG